MTKKNNNPVELEKDSENLAEAEAHLKSEPTQEEVAEAPDEEAQAAAVVAELTDTDVVVPAEIAAIHEVSEPTSRLERKKASKADRAAKKADKPIEIKKSSTKEPKSRRSKKYLAAQAKVDPGKVYVIKEAISLIKELSMSKFDGSVEIHLRLSKKKGKGSTESTRGVVHLPHGSGKERKVIVLTEMKIDEIAKTKKIDFDVAIASPELMPKVAKIAKILGPKGKMPDPKSGTVTSDPDKVMTEIKSGKTDFRIDGAGIIHLIIGKVSWSDDKLLENAISVLGLYPKTRLVNGYLTASIAPSIPLDLSKL